MQINSVKNFSFKNQDNTENKNKKYARIIEKRAYIDSKTKNLEELGMAAFLLTFISGIFDVSTVKNEHKPGKWSIGFAIATGLIFVTKWIKQMQLSKKYDKENINVSKDSASI